MRIAELFDKFVFVIFPDKFVLIPAQEIRICNKFQKNASKTDTTKEKESQKISKSVIFYENIINQFSS